MSIRIDVDCQRCGKRIGTAKVSVSLQGFNTTPAHATLNQRFLNVDHDDLKYWTDRHSMGECNEVLDRLRGKREKELTRRYPNG